jgi:hypothetical protein
LERCGAGFFETELCVAVDQNFEVRAQQDWSARIGHRRRKRKRSGPPRHDAQAEDGKAIKDLLHHW